MTIDSPTTAPTRRYLHVRREGRYDPPAVAVRLAESGLFDESLVYASEARWWFAGGAAVVLTIHHDTMVGVGEGRTSVPWAGSPARAIETLLADAPIRDWRVYGRLDYELGCVSAKLPPSDQGPELGRLTVPRVEVEVDETSLTVRALADEDLDRVLLAATAADRSSTTTTRPVEVETDEFALFATTVAAAIDRIRAGELDKVLLSRGVEVPYPVDFPATYLRGLRANTPARSFLLDLPGLRAAGFSPETLVEVDADLRIATRPLTGTCPRDGDPVFDARRRAALIQDAKEVYDHAISVRLAQDELAPLCDPDGVGVDEFMTARERGSVQHIGSRVFGRLDARHGPWDALFALFPAVTVSGVPKTAACSMIAEFEEAPRGLYAGAVVRGTHAGELDAALALRMVYTRNGRTWLRAGAGVVADSRPVHEYRGTCHTLATVAPYVVPATPEDEPPKPYAAFTDG
ncbi:salicylate synthase [Embleya sp. NPDC050154]|uniref:salicylate synthase n=1 Tax=Embleya sp. NPDC050154 TaxID=3363988 RepID=UPI00379B3F01